MIAQELLSFVCVAIVVAACFKIVKSPRRRGFVILAANLTFAAFLFYNSELRLALLLAVLAANYALLRRIGPRRGGYALACVVIVSDAALFASSLLQRQRLIVVVPRLARLFPRLGDPRFGTFMTIGASFLFLRLVHLAVEATRGLELDWLDYLNFLLLFPAYLAGPIDRFARFRDDLCRAREPDARRVYHASLRVVEGLFKRQVAALALTPFALSELLDADAARLPPWKLLIALFAFFGKLYFSFSGYTDVAIGASGLMGIDLPENFNRPYKARNIAEFWHRWHITFFEWLRDYLYFPLAHRLVAGRRLGATTAAAIAIAATVVFAAVWHGFGWHLVLYGAYHAAGLLIFFAYARLLERQLSPKALSRYRSSLAVQGLSTALTLAFVACGFLLYLDRTGLIVAVLKRMG